MSDKSNWKNKNRNILKDVGKGVVEGIKNYKLVRKEDMFTPGTLDKAKKIVEESLRMDDVISEEKGIIGGTLKVGIIPTVSSTLLPLFLNIFTN
mgnify:CR=1 FL=1